MNFRLYGELLRHAPIRRVLLVGMIARFPHSAAGVLLTLHIVLTMDRGYAEAGAVAALVTIGIAVGAPWRGRRVDTVGLRRALIPSVISEAVIWSVVPHVSYQWVLVLALIGGLFTLPVFSVVRQALGVLAVGDQRRTAYALDSIGTELVFMTGPALGAVLATQVSSAVGLTAVGLSTAVAGLMLMWFNPPTRSSEPLDAAPVAEEQEAAAAAVVASAPAAISEASAELVPTGMLQEPGRSLRGRVRAKLPAGMDWLSIAVALTFAVAAGTGLLLSATDVGIVALLESSGHSGQLGLVFATWCGASLIGGLIYGAMNHRVHPIYLLLGMALLSIPMSFATDTLSLALLSIAPGLLCAPVLSAASERVADLVREERRGEAMGWYGSALTSGTALGAPATGLAIDAVGPWAGFAFAGLIVTVLCITLLVLRVSARRRLLVSR